MKENEIQKKQFQGIQLIFILFVKSRPQKRGEEKPKNLIIFKSKQNQTNRTSFDILILQMEKVR